MTQCVSLANHKPLCPALLKVWLYAVVELFSGHVYVGLSMSVPLKMLEMFFAIIPLKRFPLPLTITFFPFCMVMMWTFDLLMVSIKSRMLFSFLFSFLQSCLKYYGRFDFKFWCFFLPTHSLLRLFLNLTYGAFHFQNFLLILFQNYLFAEVFNHSFSVILFCIWIHSLGSHWVF